MAVVAGDTGLAHDHRRGQPVGGAPQTTAAQLGDGLALRIGSEGLDRLLLELIEGIGAAFGEGVVGGEFVGDAPVAMGIVEQGAQLDREGGRDRDAAVHIAVLLGIHSLAIGGLEARNHVVGVVGANVGDQAGDFLGLHLHLRHRGAGDGIDHHHRQHQQGRQQQPEHGLGLEDPPSQPPQTGQGRPRQV